MHNDLRRFTTEMQCSMKSIMLIIEVVISSGSKLINTYSFLSSSSVTVKISKRT